MPAVRQVSKRTFSDEATKEAVTGANNRFADFFKTINEGGSLIHCCTGTTDGLVVTWTAVFPDASRMPELKAKFTNYPTPADFALIKDGQPGMKLELTYTCAAEDLPLMQEINKERPECVFNHDSFSVADHEAFFGMK
jgi:hypothetical protein